MTTTAFDDQFAPEPVAPVRERYDMVTILRRNVADLEIALKQQTDRAEAAEAELLAIREDNHSMMLEIDGMRTEMTKLREQKPVAYVKYKATGGNVGLSWLAVPTGAFYPREGEQLYVAPVHAPHKGATHCDDCGLTWLDDGLNPLRCPYCKDTVPVPAVPDEWPAIVAEMVNWWDDKHMTMAQGRVIRDKARAMLQSASTGEPK